MNKHPFESRLKKSFTISLDEIHKIIVNFHDEMQRGLEGKESSLKMLPAFVDTPGGDEEGRFIALDFGGTNFRVLQVALDGHGSARIERTKKYVIPKAVMHGTGTQLFNFIAQSIRNFSFIDRSESAKKKDLGFTFSFPMKQTNIANGILINWTKGFSATGVIGKNVVTLLRDSLKRSGMSRINVVALANDTVGTMAARSYKDPLCDVGVIFGTGTNACYREAIANITKLPRAARSRKNMVINIEWGNFNRLPFIPYDELLDRATNNPGKQRMEKMISGMYLGEIVRLILTDLIREKHIFARSKGKFAKGDFKTYHMSLIEADNSKNLSDIKEYLDGVGMLKTSLEERRLLKKICALVSQRAARISAAAISAVVTRMDPNLSSNHTVAVDGTLYEKYPRFRRTIMSALKEIHGRRSARIKVVRAKDGSGLGVAIVAAAAAAQH